jgi:hypothetical protein
VEEDLGREPHEMHEETVEAIDRMQKQLVQEKSDRQQQSNSLNLSTGIISILAMQVGISIGAISALTRKRSVWYVGLGIVAIIVPIGYANGIGFMVAGTFPSPEPVISTKSPQAGL